VAFAICRERLDPGRHPRASLSLLTGDQPKKYFGILKYSQLCLKNVYLSDFTLAASTPATTLLEYRMRSPRLMYTIILSLAAFFKVNARLPLTPRLYRRLYTTNNNVIDAGEPEAHH